MTDVNELGRLRELLAAADVLPLAYRPWQYDDWGTIRGAGTDEREESLHFIASVRDSRVDHDVFPQHRAPKTDPYEAVTKLLVEGLNALPRLLDIAEAALAAPPEVERLVEREKLLEREAAVAWLRATAGTARRMFPLDQDANMRRMLVGTLEVNAAAIAEGDHRKPPAHRCVDAPTPPA